MNREIQDVCLIDQRELKSHRFWLRVTCHNKSTANILIPIQQPLIPGDLLDAGDLLEDLQHSVVIAVVVI